MNHPTRPIQVWIDVDEGVADLVIYLNTIEGVRTHASCQGTIGEGGAEPYPAQVMVTWDNSDVLVRLEREFTLEHLGEHFGYLRKKQCA